jgi:hypothetical protein
MVQMVSEWAGRPLPTWERKVRAPEDRVVGNTDRPQGPGKCNRKQTAARGMSPRLVAAAVRVKRCGKSAPAAGATRLARQTPPGARPSRASAPFGARGLVRPPLRSGRLLEAPGNRRPREMAVACARPIGRRKHRTRLTGPLRDRISLRHELHACADNAHLSKRGRLLYDYSTGIISASITCSSLLMQS